MGNILASCYICILILLSSVITMGFWNWFMPAVFGSAVINYWQALVLILLSMLVFYKRGF